jgi:hypothetical protein
MARSLRRSSACQPRIIQEHGEGCDVDKLGEEERSLKLGRIRAENNSQGGGMTQLLINMILELSLCSG